MVSCWLLICHFQKRCLQFFLYLSIPLPYSAGSTHLYLNLSFSKTVPKNFFFHTCHFQYQSLRVHPCLLVFLSRKWCLQNVCAFNVGIFCRCTYSVPSVKLQVVRWGLSKPSKLVSLTLLRKKANHINEILDPQGWSYKNALVCQWVCMYVRKKIKWRKQHRNLSIPHEL